jgi:ATP-dependent DNA ligase
VDLLCLLTGPLPASSDLLYHGGRDVSASPLRERRARLEDVVAGSELVFPVRRLAPDGLAAWQQVVERGYEGYVAKDEASRYDGGASDGPGGSAWRRRCLERHLLVVVRR